MSIRRRAIRNAARAFALGGVFVLPLCAGAAADCAGAPPNRECESPASRYTPEWREQEAALPALPRDEDLVSIDAPAGSDNFEYLLDRASISRGDDDVMRYVIIVSSRTGASNVFFEGLRCLTNEVKTYAYAASRGAAFQRASTARWRKMARRGARGYQHYLASSILCNENGFAWDADKARRALARRYTAGGVRIERYCDDCADESRK